jgi:glutathione S-transferase
LIYVYPERHTTNRKHAAAIKEAQENRLMDMYELLDKQLAGKEYLLGKNIAVCDYFLLMVSIWARKLPRPPLSFANLGPYLEKLAKTTVVKKVFEKENISLQG